MVAREKHAWAWAMAVALLPAAAWGQARSRYQWNVPQLRGIRNIGGEFAFSAGLGGLDRSTGYAGGDVLRSSLSGLSDLRLRGRAYGDAGVLPAPGVSRTSSLTGQSYATRRLDLGMPSFDTPGAARMAGGAQTELIAGVQSYLEAMGHASALEAEGDDLITSFVPDESSVYQKYMKRGDEAFRNQRYLDADDGFDVALTYARYSPEVHLSKVHVKFALGSYSASGYHLEKALTYFPELALARLRVRGFYGRPEDFVSHLARLQKVAEGPDPDARVWLVVAYFRFFDGAEADAAKALRKAFELGRQAKERPTTEAATRFWDGMLAAGKATGSLSPGTQPAGEAGAAEAAPAQPPRPPAGSGATEGKPGSAAQPGSGGE